jgi:hypothetical protein
MDEKKQLSQVKQWLRREKKEGRELNLKPGASPLETETPPPSKPSKTNSKTPSEKNSGYSIGHSIDGKHVERVEYSTLTLSDMEDPVPPLNEQAAEGWKVAKVIHIGNQINYLLERIAWKNSAEL